MLGDWERPYLTMAPALRGAAAARLRPHHQERAPVQGREAGALVPGLPLGAGRGGGGVRGEAPRLRSTSASASTTTPSLPRRMNLDAALLGATPVDVVIWTTTPWTLPANQAVALRAEFSYVLVEAAARRCSAPLHRRRGTAGQLPQALRHDRVRRVLGQARGPRARGADAAATRCEERQVPVILGEHVTLDAGTGRGAHRPGPWPGGLRRRAALRAAGGEPGRQRRPLPARHAAGGGTEGRRGEPGDHRRRWRPTAQLLHEEPFRHSYPHCWRHKTPVIFRATPQWFISMEHEAAARAHAARHQGRAVDAGLGRAAHRRHDRDAPGLVHLAPAHLGRADPAVRAQAHRRAAPAHPGAHRWRSPRGWRPAASTPGSRLEPTELLGADARALRQGHRRHGRVGGLGPVVRVRGHRAPGESPRPWTCTWRAPTSTAAGSTVRS